MGNGQLCYEQLNNTGIRNLNMEILN